MVPAWSDSWRSARRVVVPIGRGDESRAIQRSGCRVVALGDDLAVTPLASHDFVPENRAFGGGQVDGPLADRGASGVAARMTNAQYIGSILLRIAGPK